jgi:hypothetical protein
LIAPLVIRTWNSKHALLTHLDASAPRTLVIGNDAEAPSEYYSCSIASSSGPAEMGIICTGHGTRPEALPMAAGQRVLVGHDTRITCIDVETLAVVSSQDTAGAFFAHACADDREHDEHPLHARA